MPVRRTLFFLLALTLLFSAASAVDVSSCTEITSPGTHTLTQDVSGANPISDVIGITQACIVIASENVTLDCNGFSITNNGTADAAGIVINGSSTIDYTNVTIENCPSISQFEQGVYLHRTAFDTVRNSTAYNNSGYCFYLYSSTDNILTNNTAYNNSYYGFYVTSNSVYNNLTNNTAYDNDYHGFIIQSSSSYTTLTGNTAYDNPQYGFYVYSNSNYNTLTNNIAYNNSKHGFYVYSSCRYNNLTNNTAYNNSQSGFYLSSYSEYNALTGNTAYDNLQYGFYLYSYFRYNNLTNNTAYNNSQSGFCISSNSPYNNLTDNTAYDNSEHGFYVTSNSPYNNLTNNTAYDNSYYGFSFSSSSNNTLTNNTAYGNVRGVHLNSTSLGNLFYYNNLTGNSEYNAYAEAEGNYFNTSVVGVPQGNIWGDIYSLAIYDSDSDGYGDTGSQYPYNSSNGGGVTDYVIDWGPITSQTDPSLISSCTAISSSGTYNLTQNVSGANPISDVASISQACIVIASENVTLDCNGFAVTNNGTNNAAGIVINGSSTIDYTNVTIENCPNVSQFEWGIYLHETTLDAVRNSTAYNNSLTGFYLYSSSNNTLTNSTAYDSTAGFAIYSSSNYNTLTNSTAYENEYGFFLSASSNYNTLTNNTAYNNSAFSFYIISSDSNNLTGNRAYNATAGFGLDSGSNSNNLTNNSAYGNQRGVYLHSTALGNLVYYNNFSSNTAYNAYAEAEGNYFNTTVGGVAQGNIWGDILDLEIYDSDSDGFGDTGPQYPYNSSNGGNVTNYINDWGPITSRTDTSAPAISISSPANITYNYSSAVPLNYTVSDNIGVDSCWFSLDGGSANTSISDCSNTTLSGLPGGAHNVTVYADDTSNNTNSSTVYFSVAYASPHVKEGSEPDFECFTTSDCGACEVCNDHECVLPEGACSGASDCSGSSPFYSCTECSCIGYECNADSDCADGYSCDDGECIPPECFTDSDCADGYWCFEHSCIQVEDGEEPTWEGEEDKVELGEELPPECSVDSDCAEGFVCTMQECVEEPLLQEHPPQNVSAEISEQNLAAGGDEGGEALEAISRLLDDLEGGLSGAALSVLLLLGCLAIFYLLWEKHKKGYVPHKWKGKPKGGAY